MNLVYKDITLKGEIPFKVIVSIDGDIIMSPSTKQAFMGVECAHKRNNIFRAEFMPGVRIIKADICLNKPGHDVEKTTTAKTKITTVVAKWRPTVVELSSNEDGINVWSNKDQKLLVVNGSSIFWTFNRVGVNRQIDTENGRLYIPAGVRIID